MASNDQGKLAQWVTKAWQLTLSAFFLAYISR